MKWVNLILKVMTAMVLSIFVVIPLVIYILFNLPPVQKYATAETGKILTELTGVPVHIQSLDITPFNKVFIDGITVTDNCKGDTILTVERLGAGIRLSKLITSRKLVFSFGEIIRPHLRLWRDSAAAPLNIQPIIDRLSPKRKTDNPKSFDLSINSVVVRMGSMSYDILSEPRKKENSFDHNHIALDGVRADILVPRLSDHNMKINIRRLAAKEQSGLNVTNLEANISLDDTLAYISPLILHSGESEVIFNNISATYTDLQEFTRDPASALMHVDLDESHIKLSNIAPLVKNDIPIDLDSEFNVTLSADGNINHIRLTEFSMKETGGLIDMKIPQASLIGYKSVDSLRASIPEIILHVNTSQLNVADKHLKSILSGIKVINANASIAINTSARSTVSIKAKSPAGNISANAEVTSIKTLNRAQISGQLIMSDIKLGQLTNNSDLGQTTLRAEAKGYMRDKIFNGNARIDINSLLFRNYEYNDISLNLVSDNNEIKAELQSSDDNAMFDVHAKVFNPQSTNRKYQTRVNIFRLSPQALNLTDKYPGKTLSGRLDVKLQGDDINNLNGRIELDNFQFVDSMTNGIAMDHFSLLAGGNNTSRYAIIHSDILDGKAEGKYDLANLPKAINKVMANAFPEIFPNEPKSTDPSDDCNIAINLTLRENSTTNNWLSFFNAPVKVLYPITFKAAFSQQEQSLTASVEAPYLMHKNKFIDNTALSLTIDGSTRHAIAHATSTFPTKHGLTDMSIDINSEHGVTDIGARWNVDSKKKYEGLLSMTAQIAKNTAGQVFANVAVNPTTATINDTIWSIRPSEIKYNTDILAINNFEVSQASQFIRIDGSASHNPLDRICLQLKDIDLDYVFEALSIPTAMFGGTATGDFYISEIFSKTPVLYTPELFVRDFKYNSALLGDATISSAWNPETQGITINADILSDTTRHSTVDGVIYPTKSRLDFQFVTDSINVAFLRPFMAAFTSDVRGHASGTAHLYGTFSDVNLTGDIYAQDFTLKIDYTNTYYHVTDSIHIDPGHIEFNDITIRDTYGHTAKLNGYLGHNYFHNPWFEFRMTDAKDLLCYDINSNMNPDWYGRIFCNGSALVKGVPGFIDMDINVATAANSVFNFVLSDSQAANEYTFLEFRDRNALTGDLLFSIENPSSASVRRLKNYYAENRRKSQQSIATQYHINLQVEATPQAQMILVMDPVGGDRIRARGSGNLRMEYNSSDEDLKMFGSYVLSQGMYNFTLQDIIIKDFTIKPGSAISFHGDPMNASLDIQATYTVNANLSDLDESFLQDKDLNRTNVPVHALLKVSGDVHQPDINFDLEFPTLTQDTYRKVRSIVSTDDMMNRQIIYLLALNRFYTPDYMNSTTKSNELMSVASSTISSQLSNILGQISDNWSISPNFRSDRGDFTDMEVDVALSSHLLNNRLLFNGNLGYRDKTLNTNTFIGDFDLEYLLNKSGSIRLKAYNRYNDQNYFVKSALTTQGVGIVYKKDFDNMFDFLRRKKKTQKANATTDKDKMPRQPEPSDNFLQFKPREQ